ncbi:MAG TPA: patatin-like phospholipase family protein [Thermoanaerobaculia bacterium]|jgi:hypothetical protein|nr:patatin-like phospholipase family protein [Thermoanaerobaculia bacterium]
MNGWAVAAAVLVLALVIWLQVRTGKLLQYLYFCRFSLLVAGVLVLLPFLATRTGAASLFKNLFILPPTHVFLATWLALLTTWVVMIPIEIVLRNAYLRFRVDAIALPGWVRWLKPALFALLAIPLIWTLLSQSTAQWTEPAGEEAWAVVLGVLAAFLCLLVATVLQVLFRPLGTSGEDFLLPGIARLFKSFRSSRGRRPVKVSPRVGPAAGRQSILDGYVDPDTGYIRPGHLVAFAFFLVTLGVYLYHWNWGKPPVPAGLPALGYVLLVLILVGWILPAFAFLFDRYRVPVLTLLVVASIVASQLAGTDHYYKIRPITAEPARKVLRGPSPAEAFQKDEAAEAVQHQYPIVVVAASGGGITASLWTAVVLTSLQEAVGPEFARSIRLISAVSGGSVGTMHFLDRFSGQGFPPPKELPCIVAAARASSLDSTAWGLAYPDLWRAFPGFVRNSDVDRGRAMEEAWRKEMLHGEATLEQWRQKVSQGKLPPMVFNATEVETGNQFLFTPLAKTKTWRARFFSTVYPGADIPITTAARLSATFPWVSPITRACMETCGEEEIVNAHLADGGYFDNFGVVTVINWMRSLTKEQRDEMKHHKVLVILIRAFSDPEGDDGPDGNAPGKKDGKGWLYATAGPILTMYNVRNTAQNDRNTTELSLIKDLLEKELGGKIEPVSFVLKEKSPLSWKLSDQEAARIQEGIRKNPANMKELEKVRQAFPRPVPAPALPPSRL